MMFTYQIVYLPRNLFWYSVIALDSAGNGNRIGGQVGREQGVQRAPKRVPPQRADASVDG
jgi:hypothetical protein